MRLRTPPAVLTSQFPVEPADGKAEQSFHRSRLTQHLGADLAEEVDPGEIEGLAGGDLAGAFQIKELIGRFLGVLANPASRDAAGLQEKFPFIRDAAAQRKSFLDHDRLADVEFLEILESIRNLVSGWIDVDGDEIQLGTGVVGTRTPNRKHPNGDGVNLIVFMDRGDHDVGPLLADLRLRTVTLVEAQMLDERFIREVPAWT